jgi:four helix bundle protein
MAGWAIVLSRASGDARGMPYDPEKLLVHRLALELNRMVEPLARRAAASGRRDLADQLQRAAASIPLNIAEGAAEFPPAEKARFYRMARRSAEETRTALRLIAACAAIPDAAIAPARHLTTRLTILLLNLIKSMHNKANP